MTDRLFAPWRQSYVGREPSSNAGSCFLCEAGRDADNPERLVVDRTPHHVTLLNRFPYNPGHVLIAPLEHLASPQQEGPAARAALWPLVLAVEEALREEFRPEGVNVGLNLGRSAGAGVPEHFHLHLVPRWQGDTSFLHAFADTRVISADLRTTWKALRRRLEGAP